MTNQNEELPNDDITVVEQPKETEKKPSKLGAFILRHKLVFSLLFALIVVLLWAFIKMSIMEKRFEKQLTEQTSMYETRIDSLTAMHLELTSKMLSLAIRSELTRNNKEQVNQFFLSFIKETGVQKIMLVDAATAKVLVSTDKKDEDSFFSDPVLATEKTVHHYTNSTLRVVSPVMGLNNKIGVLVIEFNRAGK